MVIQSLSLNEVDDRDECSRDYDDEVYPPNNIGAIDVRSDEDREDNSGDNDDQDEEEGNQNDVSATKYPSFERTPIDEDNNVDRNVYVEPTCPSVSTANDNSYNCHATSLGDANSYRRPKYTCDPIIQDSDIAALARFESLYRKQGCVTPMMLIDAVKCMPKKGFVASKYVEMLKRVDLSLPDNILFSLFFSALRRYQEEIHSYKYMRIMFVFDPDTLRRAIPDFLHPAIMYIILQKTSTRQFFEFVLPMMAINASIIECCDHPAYDINEEDKRRRSINKLFRNQNYVMFVTIVVEKLKYTDLDISSPDYDMLKKIFYSVMKKGAIPLAVPLSHYISREYIMQSIEIMGSYHLQSTEQDPCGFCKSSIVRYAFDYMCALRDIEFIGNTAQNIQNIARELLNNSIDSCEQNQQFVQSIRQIYYNNGALSCPITLPCYKTHVQRIMCDVNEFYIDCLKKLSP